RAPFPGFNYYRLRQVDTDGSEAHSPVRVVHLDGGGPPVQLYPNPGSARVEVRIASTATGANFILHDATGQVVLRQHLALERTTLDLSRLAPGLYAYRVLAASGAPIGHGTWLR